MAPVPSVVAAAGMAAAAEAVGVVQALTDVTTEAAEAQGGSPSCHAGDLEPDGSQHVKC